MNNIFDTQAFAVARTRTQASAFAALQTAAGYGRAARVLAPCPELLQAGPYAGTGTGMPSGAPGHALKSAFGPAFVRKPYIHPTRAGAPSGGAQGPFPPREPDPV